VVKTTTASLSQDALPSTPKANLHQQKKDDIMKTSTSRALSRLSLALVAIVVTLTASSQVQAAPTVRLFGGLTSVELSADLVGALGTLNLSPGAIEPGALREGVVRFPISGGGIDQANLSGDIFHVGGLSLTSADGTIVELFNFMIDTLGEQPVLTGLVAVNDDLVGRIPLFNLSLANAQVEGPLFGLTIQGVAASLTVDAANALNAAFGVEAFVEGFNVGVATVFALF
jgi:hypothetical protein